MEPYPLQQLLPPSDLTHQWTFPMKQGRKNIFGDLLPYPCRLITQKLNQNTVKNRDRTQPIESGGGAGLCSPCFITTEVTSMRISASSHRHNDLSPLLSFGFNFKPKTQNGGSKTFLYAKPLSLFSHPENFFYSLSLSLPMMQNQINAQNTLTAYTETKEKILSTKNA